MATRIPVPEPLPGYLYVLPLHTYSGRERPITLMAACPCGGWHRHGAGTVENPLDYAPGSIVSRVTHCAIYDYRHAQVQPEPFRPSWATPHGRIAATYLRRLTATRPGAA